ncbi:hypothetical protein T12_13713 [Trichinella patagoniensis]|uniref:Uncharacterized protein n=1 Tax=Trichinella patagoniensis TaxID=990121 RepID=A0A0V1A2G2_9BILA|nr:hypothetical protein T12_13713 [Trichinella patagoniensis]
MTAEGNAPVDTGLLSLSDECENSAIAKHLRHFVSGADVRSADGCTSEVRRGVRAAPAQRFGAGVQGGPKESRPGTTTPKGLKRPESLRTCKRAWRSGVDATPHKGQTWGLLGQYVPSPEEAGLEHVPVREGGRRKGAAGSTLRPAEAVLRHSRRRRSPGETTGEEKHAATSMALAFRTDAGRLASCQKRVRVYIVVNPAWWKKRTSLLEVAAHYNRLTNGTNSNVSGSEIEIAAIVTQLDPQL